jgi:ABC-2 type transport system ATP-binding protein
MAVEAVEPERVETPRARTAPAVDVSSLGHSYGARRALDGVSFSVQPGEIFGLLGPNGGGKTTLFQVVSTLLVPTDGTVRVFGDDVMSRPDRVREHMGVVFQKPALDRRLTVVENLRHQGHLYGLRGSRLTRRIGEVLARVKLEDRAGDLVAKLSGGLQRRAEIAKALLHGPQLLVLDEPSTGLDPSARRDVWQDLRQQRERDGTTVMLTTHLMDEAATCDRVAILHQGHLVALGAPDALTDAIGGDVILVSTREPARLAERIRARLGADAEIIGDQIRIERQRGHEFITELVEAFPGEIDAVRFGKPTLEDVFVHHTGQKLDADT